MKFIVLKNFFKCLKAQNPLIGHRWDISSQSLPSDLRKSCGREDGKTVRDRGDGGVQENKAF